MILDDTRPSRIKDSLTPTKLPVLLRGFVFHAGAFVFVAWLVRRGFEFTDEGYYLNSVTDPNLDRTTWARLAVPIWHLSGESLFFYRLIHLLIIYSVGAIIGRLMTRDSAGPIQTQAFPVVFGLLSLSIFRVWLPEPNYNTLTFLGLLIYSVSLLSTTNGSIVGMGVSTSLVVMAKPSSGALLCVISVILFITDGRTRKLPAFAAICGVSVLILNQSAGWISPFEIFEDFLGIYKGASDSGTTLLDSFRTDLRTWSSIVRAEIKYVTALSVCFALYFLSLSCSNSILLRRLFLSLVAAGLGAGFYFSQPAVLPFLVVSSLALGLPFSIKGPKVRHRDVVRGAVLVAFPFIFAFGTNTDYAYKFIQVSIFFLTGFWLLTLRKRLILPALGLAACSIAVASLATAIQDPYRQPPEGLISFRSRVLEGRTSSVLVSSETARFINNAAHLMVRGGFKSGDFLLDLTGRNPSLAFATGARPVATAWLAGNWAGAESRLRAKLATLNCNDLSDAWLIHEPHGYASFNLDVLSSLGLESTSSLGLRGTIAAYPVNGIGVPSTFVNFYQIRTTDCE